MSFQPGDVIVKFGKIQMLRILLLLGSLLVRVRVASVCLLLMCRSVHDAFSGDPKCAAVIWCSVRHCGLPVFGCLPQSFLVVCLKGRVFIGPLLGTKALTAPHDAHARTVVLIVIANMHAVFVHA